MRRTGEFSDGSLQKRRASSARHHPAAERDRGQPRELGSLRCRSPLGAALNDAIPRERWVFDALACEFAAAHMRIIAEFALQATTSITRLLRGGYEGRERRAHCRLQHQRPTSHEVGMTDAIILRRPCKKIPEWRPISQREPPLRTGSGRPPSAMCEFDHDTACV